MDYREDWNLATIPQPAWASEHGRRMRAANRLPPNPEVLAPCKYCGESMGTRDRRAHQPACRRRKREREQAEKPLIANQKPPLTPEERHLKAQNAAQARWAKNRKRGKE